MICLRNGTKYEIGPDWARVILPNDKEVMARPNAESPRSAEMLGYGGDVAAMTREHDPLHARLTDWLGLPHSFSPMLAAGETTNEQLAALEEEAVLAVQRFRRAWEVTR